MTFAFKICVAAATVAFCALPLQSFAQTVQSGSPHLTKPAKKAERKTARAKKNAELNALEKNGYSPGTGDQNNYPENIQRAEAKISAKKATAASAP